MNNPKAASQISDYNVKRGVSGTSVKYDCPGCGVRLTSTLFEAGNVDACPDCITQFVVPGEKEKIAEAQQAIQRKKDREDAAAQRHAEAEQRRAKAEEDRTRKIAHEARQAKGDVAPYNGTSVW